MKLLIVSNLYPPHYHGGYEVRCAQVAEALHRSGNDVRVLTSTYGLPLNPLGNIQPQTEEMKGVRVHRWLNQYAWEQLPVRRPWTLFHAKRELRDARTFLDLLACFRPDIVNWWSMYGLSKTLLPIPHSWGIPDVHWIEHWWMIEGYGPSGEKASAFWTTLWDGDWGPSACRPLVRLAGRGWEKRVQREGLPTRRFPNHPRHVCFVSEYMRTLHREAGFDFPSSEVIYGGVPTDQFYAPVRPSRSHSEPLRVLYVGQISQDRGLHTVVEACGLLDPALRSKLTLSVAGDGPSEYVEYVKGRVRALGFAGCVSFLGKVPHNQMLEVYIQHDILVFPSMRDEGLPLTMLEAMLAGCAVLTTGSGGAGEIAALAALPLFPKNDPVTLCRILSHLATNRAEIHGIARRGQQVALREFSFDRMMERWIATLQRIHQEAAMPKAGQIDGCFSSAVGPTNDAR